DGVGPNQSSGLLSVVAFADDLLGGFLAVLGPPLVRCAACPFFGEFAGGQFVASAEYVYCCLAQRVHVECLSSAPFDLERAIAQYRGHVVHPSLCVLGRVGLAAVATTRAESCRTMITRTLRSAGQRWPSRIW